MVLTISEDADCSGLPAIGETVCNYDEGFLAGLLTAYTGKPIRRGGSQLLGRRGPRVPLPCGSGGRQVMGWTWNREKPVSPGSFFRWTRAAVS